MDTSRRHTLRTLLGVALATPPLAAQTAIAIPFAEYQDRVHAAWLAQIAGTLMGFQFEHKAAATARVDTIPDRFQQIPVDDDWYYEMVALRAFEKHGIEMTVQQLGQQWKANSAGSWGSSEQARLLLSRNIEPPGTGHPRYNRLWFSIGPQFSADLYGMIAPAMPNLAASLARRFGHLNGYAEGVDGAVFMAGMVSLAFALNDPRQIVRQAAQLIHPDSPYRQCLDLVIERATRGASAREVANAVEDRWHMEYPATNNAVANGGLVATALWFGKGDFLETINLAFAAADFTDADCNAANAAAVIGAMRGMRAIPPALVTRLGDRIQGARMGGVDLTPPVDETVSSLAARTAALGARFVVSAGGRHTNHTLTIATQPPRTQPLERFQLSDLMRYWNPDWTLERAGFGGAGGGMTGLRGITYLDGDVLATYPRDEVRGVALSRTFRPGPASTLTVDVAADPGRAWSLEIYAANRQLLKAMIESKESTRQWQPIRADLAPFAGTDIHLRLIQRVLLGAQHAPGNAYWRNLRISTPPVSR